MAGTAGRGGIPALRPAQWAWATLEGEGDVLVTGDVQVDGMRPMRRLLEPPALRDPLSRWWPRPYHWPRR